MLNIQEILERNDAIATMLGWKFNFTLRMWNQDISNDYEYIEDGELTFHSDWNMLHHAIKFILNIDDVNTSLYIKQELIYRLNINAQIDETFILVSDFATEYNHFLYY